MQINSVEEFMVTLERMVAVVVYVARHKGRAKKPEQPIDQDWADTDRGRLMESFGLAPDGRPLVPKCCSEE
jgi:hypothetical protein